MWEIGSQRIWETTQQCSKESPLGLLWKIGLEHTEKWYEHVPEGAVENENVVKYQCSVWQSDLTRKSARG